MIGSSLGNYEILEELGRGGMGCVYKAKQPSLNRTVAVKVLLPQLAADEVFVERFMREARSIATLEHPGIVTVYDVGEADGTYYFAMQLLDGQPLDEILDEKGKLPVETAVDVVEQVAEALEFAHKNGILHRDVKPGNIILTSSGRAVLTDFGIAQALSDTRLTKTGTSIGSPEYMSPEQIEGKPLDARADLYSLGVVFYQMLTGKIPYEGESAVAIVYQHVKSPVPSAREFDPQIPERMDRVATMLMAKIPEERFASAEELLSGLQGKFLDRGGNAVGRKPAPKLPIWAWGAIGALVLVVLAIFGLGGSDDPEPTEASSSLPAETPPGSTGSTTPTASEVETSSANAADQAPAAQAIVPQPAAQPVAPKPQKLQVTSDPAGAAVVLDGRTLGAKTPTAVDLLPDKRYDLQIRLDGYDSAGWAFGLGDLSATQKSSGVLHFPLKSSVPPGTISVAADYPVQIRAAGRSSSNNRLAVPPGTHQVRLTAPSVFFSQTREVRIKSGETQQIALPIATTINIAANPSRCRVKIDGMDAGYVPSNVKVTVGRHTFEFNWESLGKTTTLTRSITVKTERVFGTPQS